MESKKKFMGNSPRHGRVREIVLSSGTKFFLGRDAESNDELMKNFKGKENTILHTSSPGSPFGVIEEENPGEECIRECGVVVARYSQSWRDKKGDVIVDVFTGKNVSKPWFSKPGTWNVRKSQKIKINRADILKFEKENKKRKD